MTPVFGDGEGERPCRAGLRVLPPNGRSATEETDRFHLHLAARRLARFERSHEVLDVPRDAPLMVRRQMPEPLRLARLIPEREAGIEVGTFDIPSVFAEFAVAFVFNRHFERLREVHRIGDVPAVADAVVARLITHPARLPEPVTRALAVAPGVVEIVFGACPLEAGDFLAVDIEKVVALAEPTALRQRQRQHRVDVLARPFEIGE